MKPEKEPSWNNKKARQPSGMSRQSPGKSIREASNGTCSRSVQTVKSPVALTVPALARGRRSFDRDGSDPRGKLDQRGARYSGP